MTIKLKHYGRYKTRKGEELRVYKVDSDSYPFRSNNGRAYTSEGCYLNTREHYPQDIIKELPLSSTERKIQVMMAAVEGEVIEYRTHRGKDWVSIKYDHILWNWEHCEYRVASDHTYITLSNGKQYKEEDVISRCEELPTK